ncbi:M48 family metallopeptidase [Clostridium ganghwense]|uniref:M48 family metallopeptidase n=1 Tax=Clostridium ganghwense TaxID=312089 RepID=A0ABT4CP97_9CLOT|nr:M48 family metallopeptidase [Clostridium ganghwense]MCY6370882.1 M48 family metallopeptidase [Clostridium ganghwense]
MKSKNKVWILIFILTLTIGVFSFTKEKSVFAGETGKSISRKVLNESKISNTLYDKNDDNLGESYYRSDRVVQAAKIIMGFLVPVVILFTGFSAKLSNFSKSIGKNLFLSIGIYGIVYNLIDSLANLPLTYYAGYIQSHVFGFSHQSFNTWIRNYSINLLLNFVGIFLFLWIPYKLMKKSPKKWWIYTGIAIIPITLFMYLAQPVIIDPLFNKFKPLGNETIERSLVELTEKANIKDCTILQIDKSRDTSMINAYMTGIGKAKRIVLWDTAINKLNLRELSFVMAHEIGHYVLGHIKKLIFIQIIITFIVLYIISKVAPSIIKRYRGKFKFNKISNVASYPLAIIIINFCLLFIVPSANAYSCYMERQADTFAIEITRDNEAAVSAFHKLSKGGVVVPKPDIFYKMWKYDHPPIKERIDFFKIYKPWEEGRSLKYDKYIINPK